MIENNFIHKSVLLEESVNALEVKSDGIYCDLTAGGGGHSAEILKRLINGTLIAVDRDPDAVKAARERLEETLANSCQRGGLFRENLAKFYVELANYSEIDDILKKHSLENGGLDGAIMDLGVSSHQLDTEERGFSYHGNSPLDMRMGKNGASAYDVVNSYSEKELAKILFEFGEEKLSRKIAFNIVKSRELKPIETTAELAEIISESYPAALKRDKNPCKKTFQAIRIEVNREFHHLRIGLDKTFAALKSGGRLSVITFHSLEDRIVKLTFSKFAKGCTCPSDFPVCVCGKSPRAKILTKKPVVPSDTELAENNRARSAKLRLLEKL